MNITGLRRLWLVSSISISSLAAIMPGSPASAQSAVYRLDLAPGPLGEALKIVAKETHQQVAFSKSVVRGKTSAPLHGSYDPASAISTLLQGSGLRADRGSSGIFLIRAIDPKLAGAGSLPVADASATRAQKTDASASDAGDIVVTAEKRVETIVNTPVPVTALNPRNLIEQNRTRLEDYFSDVPGLNFSSGDRGEIFPSIRGLTTGSYTNPTVGILVDGVPYGASAAAFSAPDIDPDDLARIEVLRGPQGTLYGVSSLGGLINYVTLDPSTTRFSGRVSAGTSVVQNGTGVGYDFRGAFNVPLTDTLAARVSGFASETPGYIDNPVRHENGVNLAHSSGVRATLLWKPTDTFSVKLSGAIQHSDADGNLQSFTSPGFGYLQQNILPGVGGFQRDVREINATIKAKIGAIDVTSVTGYLYGRIDSSVDLSSVFDPIFGVAGSSYFEKLPIKRFSQELRLSGSIGPHIDWLLGGYYSRETGSISDNYPTIDPNSGQTTGSLGTDQYQYDYREIAVFGDVTVHITDKFDVQIGGRKSQDRQPDYIITSTGELVSAFLGSDPYYAETRGAKSSPFTYLFTPQYKVSPDLMIYARLASGYRAGGGNSTLAVAGGAPSSFGPDKTNNYEIGVKGKAFDHVLTYDISVYHIDWQDIQLGAETSIGQSYFANGGSAKSQGVELSLQARPVHGLTVGGWFTYSDAVLTKGFPTTATTSGAAGDRLPYSGRYSGNFSIQQDFPITSDLMASIGGAFSYVDKRIGNFGPTSDRAIFPSYTKTDLHAGLKYDNWDLNIYANNLTRSHGVQGGGIDGFPANAVIYIQPQTFGMSVARHF